MLFSRDAAHFATGDPDIRDFNLTNEASLAGIFDDNSAPLSFLRSSVGHSVGGPLVDKNFPTPGGGFLALPEDPATPLYSWENYREVGAAGHPLELNDAGAPYTSREGEVSDMRQLARTLFEAPANFIEQYFPTRILTDVGRGRARGGFAELRYDGPVTAAGAARCRPATATRTRPPTRASRSRASRRTSSSSAARSSSPATTTSTSPPRPGARTTAARSRPARRWRTSRSQRLKPPQGG